MWDSSLYTMNVLLLLVNKEATLARQNIARWAPGFGNRQAGETRSTAGQRILITTFDTEAHDCNLATERLIQLKG